MVKKIYKPEQIINKLGEAEILISQGATAMEASRYAYGTNLESGIVYGDKSLQPRLIIFQ